MDDEQIEDIAEIEIFDPITTDPAVNPAANPAVYPEQSIITEELSHFAIHQQVSDQVTLMELNSILSHYGNMLEDVVFECGAISGIIKVYKTPKDGNCMFAAIAHQLNPNVTNTSELAIQMRAKVVNHIHSNYSDFEMVLKSRVYEEFDCQTKMDLDKEARNILTHLAKNNYWGSTESLKAFSEIFEVNILLIKEDGDCYFPLGFSNHYGRALVLAFRKSIEGCLNHYDSVIKIDQQLMVDITETIALRYNCKN